MGSRVNLSSPLIFILTIWCFHISHASITQNETRRLRDKTVEMFDHAFSSYMTHAFPADELMPLTCQGRYRGVHPNRGDIDESLGNFTLTLVDTLDTLALLGKYGQFEEGIRYVLEKTSFDTDVVVSVFETNIRMVGGLLGAHVSAIGLKAKDLCCSWYTDGLLLKAKELALRLLPAFNTTSGIPYPKVNLRNGLSGLDLRDTCTACAGTMVLEFAALSRLTGDDRFENVAHKAMDFLWHQRNHHSNLMGTVLNIHNGDWVRRESGIGAGIDSYYEYVLKAYILLGEEVYLQRFNKHYEAIMRYLSRGPIMISVDMHKPTIIAGANIMDALLAFWPGLQVLKGDIKSAIEMHEVLYQITQRHNFLPEAVTADFHVHWAQHPLRPEFVESTYFLFKATGDPYYLEVGRSVLENLEKHARVPCGFAAIKDVRAGTHEDQMDSYVLAETFKYLYLLFEDEANLPFDMKEYIFTTEAHILPLSLAKQGSLLAKQSLSAILSDSNDAVHHDRFCPNTREFDRLSSFRYAEQIRSKLKNFVELKCPKPRSSRTPRLRAVEFIATDDKHVSTLKSMGVQLSQTSDGRLQLVHSPNLASSPELAEEGLAFMREMLGLAQGTDNPIDHRVVQLIAAGSQASSIYQAGSAQFGYDFAQNKDRPALMKSFKDGVKALAGKAMPITACEPLMNGGIVAGRIVLAERGGCTFIDKARNSQAAGAAGLVVIDNATGSSSANTPTFQMSGDGTKDVTIPIVFLFHTEGQEVLASIAAKPDTEVYIGKTALSDADLQLPNHEKTTLRPTVLYMDAQMNIWLEARTFQISCSVQKEIPASKEDTLADNIHADVGTYSKDILTISVAQVIDFDPDLQTKPDRSQLVQLIKNVIQKQLPVQWPELSEYIDSTLRYILLIYETDTDHPTRRDEANVHKFIQRLAEHHVLPEPSTPESVSQVGDGSTLLEPDTSSSHAELDAREPRTQLDTPIIGTIPPFYTQPYDTQAPSNADETAHIESIVPLTGTDNSPSVNEEVASTADERPVVEPLRTIRVQTSSVAPQSSDSASVTASTVAATQDHDEL